MSRQPLRCSAEEFESLHRDRDRVRSTSKTVTVSVPALRALLMDHAHLIALNEGKIAEPTETARQSTSSTNS